jgi:hypothetical protein
MISCCIGMCQMIMMYEEIQEVKSDIAKVANKIRLRPS